MIGQILLTIVTILLLAGIAAVAFWAGVTYCRTRMLPTILARMTDKELDELADRTAEERDTLDLPEAVGEG